MKKPKLPLRVKCKESREVNQGRKVTKGAIINLLNNKYLVIWEINDWGLTTSEWVQKNELEEIANPLYRNKLVTWEKQEVKSRIESIAQYFGHR